MFPSQLLQAILGGGGGSTESQEELWVVTKGKAREASSTSSFKPLVKVVNWANCRRLGVHVLDETGHRAPLLSMTQAPRRKVGNQHEPCLYK